MVYNTRFIYFLLNTSNPLLTVSILFNNSTNFILVSL